MAEYTYNRENVVNEIEGLAEVRLSGPFTLEVTAWGDGDFIVRAYHTIDATFPFDAEARDDEHGRPFCREQLAFSTMGDDEGWIRHEVIRAYCGLTRETTIHSERVGGYTFNWPGPIDDSQDESTDSPEPRVPYLGRFA